MADDFSDIMFVQIDAYEADKVSTHYNVEAVPSFVFLKDGDEIGRLVQPVGLSSLKEALDKLKALQGQPGCAPLGVFPNAFQLQAYVEGGLELFVAQTDALFFQATFCSATNTGYRKKKRDTTHEIP